MEPMRIMVASSSDTLQRGVQSVVSERADLVLVRESRAQGMELLLAAQNYNPDVVILSLVDDELPGVCTHLLSQDPSLRILGINADTGRGYLVTLETHTEALEASPQDLDELIRRGLLMGQTTGGADAQH